MARRIYPDENFENTLRQKADRNKVLAAYGDKCVCCGETESDFLQLDHVKDDGAEHRKLLKKVGYSLVAWAIRFNYPDSLQLLCANCNHGKRVLSGICPHELNRPLDIESLCEDASRSDSVKIN